MHCQIIDSVIQEPQNLPIVFKNVSNFHLLTNPELAKYGWYPYMVTAPPIINPAVQKLTERRTFNGVIVLQSWSADTMTAAEALAYATATLTDITRSITSFLNQAVASRSYDTIVTAKSWLNSSEPDWAREAAEANAYADSVWKSQKATVAAVQAGTQQVPTKAAFFAQFPPLWPPSNGNGPIV
jgi:hypothetical protein